MHEDDDFNHTVLSKGERDYLSKALRESTNDSFHRELRVQFASAALTGMMADHTIKMPEISIARVCWSLADAMLATMGQDAQGNTPVEAQT